MGENRSMNELERVFKNAIYENYAYVAIRVRMKGFKDDELIINTENNVESKLEYYKNTYDENLNHKYSQGISIVDFYTGDTLEEIEGMYENSIL